MVSDAHQGTIEGGDRAGLSHQSQCGGGSEVTLAPHLVQDTQIGERRGKCVSEGMVVVMLVWGVRHFFCS